ncbi:hypothetical protein J4405_01315 [Candidatus Woesearchaeota archaeon]|nr:hypothetical protein [Candidatus Woesearchaeota archaeon]
MKTIPKKYLWLSALILFINLLFRLINQSKLITVFPLDTVNDYSGHMAMLFFLKDCGFHQICPYWYHGYTTFSSYTPGWAFFTYPIYLLLNNILLATYLSLIILLVIGFYMIYKFGKMQGFSFLYSVVFFLFVFANPMSIGDFIRLGRMSELFSWVIFIPLFFLSIEYVNKKLDKFFYIIFIIFYTILMISHPVTIILAHIMLFGLFLVINKADKIKMIFLMILGLILSSFWWFNYLLQLKNNSILNYSMGTRSLEFSGQWLLTNIVGIIIPIVLLVISFLYFYKNRIKKEFIFFLPILILTILFLFRITAFLPILDKVYPDSVITLLIFFIVYYLLKIDFNLYKSWIKKIIILGIIFFAVLSIIANAVHTPYFVDHTPLENNILSLLEELPKDSKFVIFGINSTTSYSNAYYSYAPIFLNLSTSGGWSYSEKDAEYVKKFKAINQLLNEKNCEAITENLNYVNTTHIITQNDNCNTLEFCNLKKLKQINDVCLFQT